MTKEEKIARYSKLNQEVVPGKIAMILIRLRLRNVR